MLTIVVIETKLLYYIVVANIVHCMTPPNYFVQGLAHEQCHGKCPAHRGGIQSKKIGNYGKASMGALHGTLW